jgi:hypothetical protein
MSNILINPLIARPTGGLKLVLLVLISYMLGMQVNLEPGHSYAEDLDVSMSLPSENGISTERNELFVMNHEPAWPQQDNSIQQAIRGAHRIGVNQTPTIDGTYYMWNGTQCESPPKGMATVVTAYYDLSSKHPRHQYEEWIQNMIKATDPMIIFIDPTSDYFNWWPMIEKHRQHAPTLLVSLPFRNLTMSTVFSDEFWKTYILPRDRTYRYRKGVDVYKIWNEKMILMREVAQENPFDTEFFYWIDAGYFRRKTTSPIFSPIVRNNITDKGVERHQLVYQMINEFPTFEIAGGAWGGTADAIRLHYQKYWQTFWYLTLYSDKECVGFEQRVLVWMCRSFPKICVINKSLNWFAMGTDWLRKTDYDFLYTTTKIPKDKTTTVPRLVEPSKLIFPKESIIRLVDEIPKGALSLEQKMNYSHEILQSEIKGRKKKKVQ